MISYDTMYDLLLLVMVLTHNVLAAISFWIFWAGDRASIINHVVNVTVMLLTVLLQCCNSPLL